MKKSARLLLAAGILAVMVAALVLIPKLTASDPIDVNAFHTGVVIMSLAKDDATALRWTYDGETVEVVRSGDGWECSNDPQLPINLSRIDAMLSALNEVESSRTLEQPEDLAEFGLAEPICSVAVDAGEQSLRFDLGDTSMVSSKTYCSLGDGNVYLVNPSLLSAFSFHINDIVSRFEVPSITAVTGFRVQRGDKVVEATLVTAETDSAPAVWKGADSALCDDLAFALTCLTPRSAVNYREDTLTLSDWGLDDPYVVSYDYEGGRFKLELARTADGLCYGRLPEDYLICKIDDGVLDALDAVFAE